MRASVPFKVKSRKASLLQVLGSYAFRFAGELRAAVAIPGSKHVLVAAGQAPPTLFDVESGAEVAALKGHAYDSGYSLAVSPDGKLAASGGADREVIVWDLKKRKPLARIPAKPLVVALAFTADSQGLIVGDDRTPKVYEARTGKALKPFKGHSSRIEAIAVSPDGQLCATAAGDAKVKLHDVASRKQPLTFKGYSKSLAFSADSKRLFLFGGIAAPASICTPPTRRKASRPRAGRSSRSPRTARSWRPPTRTRSRSRRPPPARSSRRSRSPRPTSLRSPRTAGAFSSATGGPASGTGRP
ncbi:MAG: hypothetical protein QM765_20960 [Myxococcales bacterium]